MVMKRETAAVWEVVINEGNGHNSWCRLHWSANAGKYGHQVVWERCIKGGEFEAGNTGGCGYCKISSAFESFVQAVIGRYPGRVGGYEPGQFARLFCEGSEAGKGNYVGMTREQLEAGVVKCNE